MWKSRLRRRFSSLKLDLYIIFRQILPELRCAIRIHSFARCCCSYMRHTYTMHHTTHVPMYPYMMASVQTRSRISLRVCGCPCPYLTDTDHKYCRSPRIHCGRSQHIAFTCCAAERHCAGRHGPKFLLHFRSTS